MNFFVDLTNERLVVSAQSSTALGAVRAHQNDNGPVSVVLLVATGAENAPYTVVSLPAPYTKINLGLRPADDLDNPGLLCSATGFTVSGSGDTLHYTAAFNRNTVEIGDAFTAAGAKAKTLSALLDIELTNDDATVRNTPVHQAEATITRDIFRGDEGDPVSGYPPTLDSATTKRGATAFAIGDESKAVVFDTAFSSTPRMVLLTAHKLNPGDANPPTAYAYTSKTVNGFTILLSGAALAAGEVDWVAFL